MRSTFIDRPWESPEFFSFLVRWSNGGCCCGCIPVRTSMNKIVAGKWSGRGSSPWETLIASTSVIRLNWADDFIRTTIRRRLGMRRENGGRRKVINFLLLLHCIDLLAWKKVSEWPCLHTWHLLLCGLIRAFLRTFQARSANFFFRQRDHFYLLISSTFGEKSNFLLRFEWRLNWTHSQFRLQALLLLLFKKAGKATTILLWKIPRFAVEWGTIILLMPILWHENKPYTECRKLFPLAFCIQRKK